MLRESKRLNEELHTAVRGGNKERVIELLKQGADVNASDEHGNTPLHFAAWGNHQEVIELLLGSGADFDAKNQDQKTILDNWLDGLFDVQKKRGEEFIKRVEAVREITNAKFLNLHSAFANFYYGYTDLALNNLYYFFARLFYKKSNYDFEIFKWALCKHVQRLVVKLKQSPDSEIEMNSEDLSSLQEVLSLTYSLQYEIYRDQWFIDTLRNTFGILKLIDKSGEVTEEDKELVKHSFQLTYALAAKIMNLVEEEKFESWGKTTGAIIVMAASFFLCLPFVVEASLLLLLPLAVIAGAMMGRAVGGWAASYIYQGFISSDQGMEIPR